MVIIKERRRHHSKYKNHGLYGLMAINQKNFDIQKKENQLFKNNYNSLIFTLNNAKQNLLNRLLVDIEKFPIVSDNNVRYQLKQFLVVNNNGRNADAFIASAKFGKDRIIYIVEYNGYQNNIHYLTVAFLNCGPHEVPVTDKKDETIVTPYSDSSDNYIGETKYFTSVNPFLGEGNKIEVKPEKNETINFEDRTLLSKMVDLSGGITNTDSEEDEEEIFNPNLKKLRKWK